MDLGGSRRRRKPVLGQDPHPLVGAMAGQRRKPGDRPVEHLRRRRLLAGDDARLLGAERGRDVDPPGDPVAVALGMDRVGDVAVVDQQRLQRDAGFGDRRTQLVEKAGIVAVEWKEQISSRPMPSSAIFAGTSINDRVPAPHRASAGAAPSFAGVSG